MRRADSSEKILMLVKIEGRKRRGWQDEMVGWHHQLDGHEFEQAPGVGDGQGGLVCRSPRSRKELDMTGQLNWTELKCFLISNHCCCYCCLVAQLCPTLLRPHELYPTRLLCLWDFPDKNTRVGSSEDLPNPGIEPMCLLHWQMVSLPLSYQGSPLNHITSLYRYI